MKLVVGLGNPGPEYETTRHNIGFLAADRLVDRWRATGPAEQYQAEVYKGGLDGQKLLIAKPQTFMNRSGISVGALMSFYKISAGDLVVIHDDLDLPPMGLRIKTGGGDGGHNGLKSIDQHLGALGRNYHRIRVGIGRPVPRVPGAGIQSPSDYVLDAFSEPELNQVDSVLDEVAEAVELCLRGQVKEAMNRFNRKAASKEDSEDNEE